MNRAIVGNSSAGKRIGRALALVAAALVLASPLAAEDDAVIEDVLEILRERGIVDEAQHASLVSKHEKYEEEHESLLGRIELSGDMRVRYEHFWFHDTTADEDRPERGRGRYRFRLKGKARVNEYVDAVFRFTSGEITGDGLGGARSANRTLGRSVDFQRDPIFVDLAYIGLKAPSAWVGEAGKLSLTAGRVPNPFLWKKGQDNLMWDHDFTFPGAAVTYAREIGQSSQLFANAGYFIADENSTRSDPHVFGGQLGVVSDVAEDVEIGGRATIYDWRSLDEGFLRRGAFLGNVTEGTRSRFAVGEFAAYVEWSGVENWPFLLTGHIAKNFNALDAEGVGKQDLGWFVGMEVGDKKKYVKLGGGYSWQEANYWPAQFTDSDLFDGRTNRKGFLFYGSRTVLRNTDLGVTLFVSEPISESPAFDRSIPNSDRIRLQADLKVKF